MNPETATLRLQFVEGIWLGGLDTPDGIIEVLLDGTPEAPDRSQAAALQAFLPTVGATIKRLRRKLPFAFLYHPIRFAVNDQNRVGVQFRNRFTGSQTEVLFADEP
jgi:hypothetical protein